ncbi:MAG TPA: nucleotidyltransferase domain-containing protein [Solirubrobacterales bacterium]|nr:nucleotidyltransferase domain-containing protein [Solirubrobacterales bacterium]
MGENSAEGALERLSETTGQGFSNLSDARRLAAEKQPGFEEKLRELNHDRKSSVVLFGSWARRELTEYSDDDWLILVNGAKREEIAPTIDEVASILGIDERKPGEQEIFGIHAFCDDIQKVGLDRDDNKNVTHRVLLMLESIPFTGHAAHRECWNQILDGYLQEVRRDKRPPRFFLNDVVRYWRTICVDFVGKHRKAGDKWGTRNAKLRASRKVLFAGGLLPILQCFQFDRGEMRAFLVDQLTAPATDRLAYAFLEWGAPDPGARFFTAYDRWVGLLNDETVRDELNAVTPDDADESAAFREVQGIGRDLERGLLTLLFETRLEPISRQYGIF